MQPGAGTRENGIFPITIVRSPQKIFPKTGIQQFDCIKITF
jgi:hypothetical protein